MKIKTNKVFDSRFEKVFHKSKALPQALLKIVNSGFISENGAWFIAALYKKCPNLTKTSFSTPLQFECYVNHFHLDDYCKRNQLGNALACDAALRQQLNSQIGRDLMCSIISLDETGCVFRCHVIRAGERWIVNDLNSYKEEAILVIDP